MGRAIVRNATQRFIEYERQTNRRRHRAIVGQSRGGDYVEMEVGRKDLDQNGLHETRLNPAPI